MLGKYVFPEIHSQRQIHGTSSNISQYFTRSPHIQALTWYNKHTRMGINVLKSLTCLISCLFIGSPCTYEFFDKNGKACSLWDVIDRLKYGTYLTKKVFITVSSLQLLWWLKARFLPETLIEYEKREVKRIPIHFVHYWTKGEQNFTTKCSHVRLLRTEKIPSFNYARRLPGIYLLFHNLFRKNS